MDEINMEHRMTRVEKLSEGNKRRIEDLEKDNKVLHELSSSVMVMAEQLKQINERIARLDGSMQRVNERPAKWWDTLIKSGLSAIVGALIAAALLRLGLK